MSTALDNVPEVEPVLTVKDLRVDLDSSGVDIVSDISFEVAPGEILGVIGESGCGKTTVLTSLLGYTRAGATIRQGQVIVDGVDLLQLAEKELRAVRGNVVSYVPQDPGSALNPALKIATQLAETLAAHGVKDRGVQLARMRRLLEEVKLPSDDAFLKRYPHELSGGQQQRVAIAMAFLCEPKVAVLDEPTTGLDVTTQSHVLDAVRSLCQSHRTAGVFVSHDIAAVSEIADRTVVMYAGRIVESGSSVGVTARAAHPYTRALIDAIPDPKLRRPLQTIKSGVSRPGDRPTGCVFSRRCDFVTTECESGPIPFVEVSAHHRALCLRLEALPPRTWTVSTRTVEEVVADAGADVALSIEGLHASYGGNQILKGVDLVIPRGIVMGLVGESGSGKSTLARSVGGLHEEATGQIRIDGQPLPFGSRRRSMEHRLLVQYIFQNASSALNPRKTIGESIAEPMRTLGLVTSQSDRREQVARLLEDVALSPDLAKSYPVQLSGGERQRVTVARALATAPKVLICDEITSSLDVSVQASILLLIEKLQQKSDLTLLFVTHNLGVVRAIADRVAVLESGKVVENSSTDDLMDDPQHPYTQRLLKDTPSLPRLVSDSSKT